MLSGSASPPAALGLRDRQLSSIETIVEQVEALRQQVNDERYRIMQVADATVGLNAPTAAVPSQQSPPDEPNLIAAINRLRESIGELRATVSRLF